MTKPFDKSNKPITAPNKFPSAVADPKVPLTKPLCASGTTSATYPLYADIAKEKNA